MTSKSGSSSPLPTFSNSDSNSSSTSPTTDLIELNFNLLSVIHNPRTTSSSSSYYDMFFNGPTATSDTGNNEPFPLLPPDPATNPNPGPFDSSHTRLPPYMTGLDVNSVESYVNANKHETDVFCRRKREIEQVRGIACASAVSDSNEPPRERGGSEDVFAEGIKPFGGVDVCRRCVPADFFEESFTLSDPKMFEKWLINCNISSDGDGNGDGGGDGSSSNSSICSIPSQSPTHALEYHETLTQYLDLVEVSLLRQIRARSSDFFRETTRFQTLKQMVTSSTSEVATLRATLQKIKEERVDKVNEVPELSLRRNNLIKLKNLLAKIGKANAVNLLIPTLLEQKEYVSALDQISTARKLLKTDNLDESGKITIMDKISERLTNSEQLVVNKISNTLVGDIMAYDPMMRGNDKILAFEQIMKSATVLQTTSHLQMAAGLYSQRLLDTVKVTVKTTVSECASDVGGSGGGGGVTSMSFPQFISCLEMLFEQILALLSSSSSAVKALKVAGIDLKMNLTRGGGGGGVGDGGGGGGSGGNPGVESENPLFAASELAHRSISELLRIRKDAHSLLGHAEMKQMWDSCLAFTLELETHSIGIKAWGLRSTLLSQAKAFVEVSERASEAA